MAEERLDPRTPRSDAGRPEPSLGDLIKQLSADSGRLIQQEVALAKTEMRQAGATLARDGTKIGIAVGLALAGTLALTAFLVLALGDALDNYWLSALIVGVLLLAIGAILVRSAVRDIKERGLMPAQTMETLREDAAWAKQESREFKRELTR